MNRKKRFSVLALGAVTLAIAAGPLVVTSHAVGGQQVALVNGGFESPVIDDGKMAFLQQDEVPGWKTTDSSGDIELWSSWFQDFEAHGGRQFAELNSREAATLYQDLDTVPGTVMSWSLAHRGRDGTDVMQVLIGRPGSEIAQTPSGQSKPDISDGKDAWGKHGGIYTVPAGQKKTRFAFKAVHASGGLSVGNFLDDVEFRVAVPKISAAKSVDKASAKPGDELTYTVKVANEKNVSTASGVNFSDAIPAGTSYVEDSLRVDGKRVSDAAGDDSGEVAGGKVTVHLGEGAGATDGGTLRGGAESTVSFKVRVDDDAKDGASVSNAAKVDYSFDQALKAESNTVSTKVTNQADLALTKAVDKASAQAGDTVTYDLTLRNDGPMTSRGVEVTDYLPPGFRVTESQPSQGTFDEQSGVWSVGDVPNGTSLKLSITGILPADTALVTNSAEVTKSDTPDPDSTPGNGDRNEDDWAEVSTRVSQSADIKVEKRASDSEVIVGQETTFTITATNAGPSTAKNVKVVDRLPAGLTYVSDNGQGKYDPATGIWKAGDIKNGGSTALAIKARVDKPGQLINQVTSESSETYDPTPYTGPSEAQAAVAGLISDVALTSKASASEVNAGDEVTYTLEAANTGTAAAKNVEVTAKLPAGFQVSGSKGSSGAFNPATGVWKLSELAATNGKHTLEVTGRVAPDAGDARLDAEVTASDTPDVDSTPNNHDPSEDDQTATTVKVTQLADVSLAQTLDKRTPKAGEQVAFTVTAANAGPSTARGLEVTDTLPRGLSGVTVTSKAGKVEQRTGRWTIGDLPAGESMTMTVTGTVKADTDLVNTAEVTKASVKDPDSTPDNGRTDEDDYTTLDANVTQVADIKTAKGVDKAEVPLGEDATFTLSAVNDGPSQAKQVRVEDRLPAGLEYVSSEGDGSFDAQRGIWSVGDLDNGAKAEMKVTVKVNTTAQTTNTITGYASSTYDPTPAGVDNGHASVRGQAADLTVAKSVDKQGMATGENAVYTLTATNNGPDDTAAVKVEDELPGGMEYISSMGNGSYNSKSGTWAIGNLKNGQSASMKITVKVTGTGKITNNITGATSLLPDPTPDNTAHATVTAIAKVAPEKSEAPESGGILAHTGARIAGVVVAAILLIGAGWVIIAATRKSRKSRA
ncbi:isopeptide-forming domain-containing fimbrial protein [Streptomyces erythrochromogenes]|uniref:COG1361 S-layer family protein n=1 Tax=Streptomyces erythrochromogenes TaxID=285574 RepID=UPI0036A2355A